MNDKIRPEEIRKTQTLERKKRMSKDGGEVLDPKPRFVKTGIKKPESIQDQIKRMIRSERMAQAANKEGYESFEEADDFEVGDDYDPKTPWEEDFEGQFDQKATGKEFVEEKPIDKNNTDDSKKGDSDESNSEDDSNKNN